MSTQGLATQDWPTDGRHAFAVMDGTGDTKTIWDPNSPDEVEHARQTFDSFKAKGYVAYRVQEKGDKGEVMRAFDPQAKCMILAKPMVGG
jgi:hypothetical protein